MAAKKHRSSKASARPARKARTQVARLSHVDAAGALTMVDVSGKSPTLRTAVAEGRVLVGAAIARLLKRGGRTQKGNVFEAARLAGILAAKRVDQLIPLCHGLPVDAVLLAFRLTGDAVWITAEVRTTARTGVEMEALTAVSIAALTVYDMCKAVSKGITIGPVQLVSKTGGKSGDYLRRGRTR